MIKITAMKTEIVITPEMNIEFIRVLKLMCQPCPPFIKNQPKTRAEIDTMVKTLQQFCDEIKDKKEIKRAQAQIQVLTGKAKATDFNRENPELLKAAKMAAKWLQGKTYDDALFL